MRECLINTELLRQDVNGWHGDIYARESLGKLATALVNQARVILKVQLAVCLHISSWALPTGPETWTSSPLQYSRVDDRVSEKVRTGGRKDKPPVKTSLKASSSQLSTTTTRGTHGHTGRQRS
eukprot:TRINITY_DN14518_c0_g1_i1.p1 TRINITY_DN14518_c0_g1~~TRINITY_DN14518_c0_g1_i1.p1  ORF type:complete len:123 (+),score=1.18 TRINITY_DN14518_c0_g1_i1:767-1135(+)